MHIYISLLISFLQVCNMSDVAIVSQERFKISNLKHTNLPSDTISMTTSFVLVSCATPDRSKHFIHNTQE